MKTYIALFRGINVGGKNILPMKELKIILQNLGQESIITYIQSGNVIFRSKESDTIRLSGRIGQKIKEKFNFEPKIIILKLEEFKAAISKNPFSLSESVHFGFLSAIPAKPNLEEMERIRKENEEFKLIEKVFYLNAPDGIGRSKLAASSEKLLGVTLTDRNEQTVQKINELAKEINN